MPRLAWLTLPLFGIGLVAAAWHTPNPPLPEPIPTASAHLTADELPPTARESPERISLTRLPDSRLAAAWLDNGDTETAAIRLAIRDSRGWREMGRIATRESTAAATFMHAQGLGRPTLWSEGGWLHLWYEAYPLGRGGGASIIHSLSTDGGRNWKQTRRLESSAFGGLGPRLGKTPIALTDGGLLLPLAERGSDGPWLRLSPTGEIVEQLPRLPADSVATESAR